MPNTTILDVSCPAALSGDYALQSDTVFDVASQEFRKRTRVLTLTNGVITNVAAYVEGAVKSIAAKADLVGGIVPATQLPSYVDGIDEYANLAAFPATGEDNKIYVALDTSFTYRWSGSAYVRLNEGVVLGETALTAYRGDLGKVAYDHAQLVIGNPHAVNKADVALGSADNTADADKPVSSATQAALDAKVEDAIWDGVSGELRQSKAGVITVIDTTTPYTSLPS